MPSATASPAKERVGLRSARHHRDRALQESPYVPKIRTGCRRTVRSGTHGSARPCQYAGRRRVAGRSTVAAIICLRRTLGTHTRTSIEAEEGAGSMSIEENKALVRRWWEETDKGNDAIVDELCAPDYIDHSPPLPGMGPGRAGVRKANATLRAAFPDTIHIIEDLLAEGDKVVTRLRGRATFTGEILGIPPNGKVVEITGISIHRIAGGKLVEHWANADQLGLMQQLGALPAPEQAPA